MFFSLIALVVVILIPPLGYFVSSNGQLDEPANASDDNPEGYVEGEASTQDNMTGRELALEEASRYISPSYVPDEGDEVPADEQ